MPVGAYLQDDSPFDLLTSFLFQLGRAGVDLEDNRENLCRLPCLTLDPKSNSRSSRAVEGNTYRKVRDNKAYVSGVDVNKYGTARF
jgi:hypothetical protein